MYFGIAITALMLIASFSDIKKKEIALWQILSCGALSAARIILQIHGGTLDPMDLTLSFLPGVTMILIAFLTRQSLGYGDGILGMCIGPALGAEIALLGICGAVMASGMVSGILLVLKKAKRNSRIPFVPFMTMGVGVMMLAPL